MCKKTRFTNIAILALASVIGLTPYDVSAYECDFGFYTRLLHDQDQASVDPCKKRHEEFLSEIRAHAKSEVCTSTCQSQTKDGVASVPCDHSESVPPSVESLPWADMVNGSNPASLVSFISQAQKVFTKVRRSFVYICKSSKTELSEEAYYAYKDKLTYNFYDYNTNKVNSYFEIDKANFTLPSAPSPKAFQTVKITGNGIWKNTVVDFKGPSIDYPIKIHAPANPALPASLFQNGFSAHVITPFGGTRSIINKYNDSVELDRPRALSYLWTVLPTVLGIPSLVWGSVLLQQDGQCLTAQNYSCAGKVHQLDLAIPLFVVGLAHVVVPSIVRQIKVIGYLDRIRTVP